MSVLLSRGKLAWLSIILPFLFSLPALSQCAPLGGIGSLQWFDNNGNVLTNGAIYFFAAGSSTQTPTYSDSACTVLNVNPLPFGAGARVTVWVPATNFKMVLCASSTDGATCSAADVLFSIDNLPGASSGGGGGGGGAPFIDNAANPATSGLLRLASGSSICWRNTANSSNLCISKDVNDVLTFFGGFKIAEGGAPTCAAGIDFLWPDNTAHRWKQCYNGSAATQVVASGNDIGTTDQVLGIHFGTSQQTFGNTAPTTNQAIVFNGTNLVGATVSTIAYNTPSASTNASIGSTTMATASAGGNKYLFNAFMLQTVAGSGCTTSSTVSLQVTYTDAQTSLAVNFNLLGANEPTQGTLTLSPTLGNNNGIAGGQGLAWFPVVINAKASTTISYLTTFTAGTCTTAPSYYVLPVLQLIG